MSTETNTLPITTVGEIRAPTGKRLHVCGYCKAIVRTKEQVQTYFELVKQLGDFISANPEWEYAGIYADRLGVNDEPASSQQMHPQLKRMLDDCRNNTIERVIVPDMAHLGSGLTLVMRELKELHVSVYFMKERIDTATSDGEMLLSVLLDKSDAQTQKPKLKKPPKPRDRTIGYTRIGRIITVCEPEAEIVRRIFRECLAGNGAMRIVRILEDEGVPTVKGCAVWNQKTVIDILHNERYCGSELSFDDEPAKREYREPLVSREDWERVQELLRERLKPKDKPRATAKVYPYTSIAVCGYCGKHMVHAYIFGSGRWKKDIYICGTHHKRASHCPDSKAYSEHCIEHALIEACNKCDVANEMITSSDRLQVIESFVFYGSECDVKFKNGSQATVHIPNRLLWRDAN